MQQIVPSVKTMSSVELVDVINAMREEGAAELRHDHFMAKAEKVIGEGVLKFRDTYIHPQNGQKYPCYRLPKREASLMVMSESYAVQARVYDRMTELEAIAAPPKAVRQSRDPALAAIRQAKALQLNIESANALCARFPSLGTQSQQVIFAKVIGGDILPLPTLSERTYTATEVAEKYGKTANYIGRLANAYGLKTSEFGIFVLDKSASSDKQVESFRYNDIGVERLGKLLVRAG